MFELKFSKSAYKLLIVTSALNHHFSKLFTCEYSQKLVTKYVTGFVIEGFQNDGKDFCQFEDESFTDVLSSALVSHFVIDMQSKGFI